MSNLTRVRIIGIDCAADPKNIAVASAIQAGARLTVDNLFFGQSIGGTRTKRLKRLATDIAKQASTETPTLLAFDAPLGWPVAMRQALAEGVAGSVAGVPDDASHMFRRITDRFVARETHKVPQSVGASLVARLTHTALRLIHMIEEECREHNISMATAPMSRHDSFRQDVHLIEVYPALVGPLFLDAQSHGFKNWSGVSDKLKKFREENWDIVAQRLEERLQTDCASWTDEVVNDTKRLHDHGLDAILCAWTAWRFLQGKCVSPALAGAEITDEHLAREGWIWFDRQTPALGSQRVAKKVVSAR